ncbi:MAG TPA: Hpt domain-containing protein, partial [Chloroflexota bacterium]
REGELAELIEMFVEDTAGRLNLLHEAAARQDARTLLEVGHALRGAAGHFGVREMVEACERLEGLARGGTLGGASDVVDELDRAYARARNTLDAIRGLPRWSGQQDDAMA